MTSLDVDLYSHVAKMQRKILLHCVTLVHYSIESIPRYIDICMYIVGVCKIKPIKHNLKEKKVNTFFSFILF